MDARYEAKRDEPSVAKKQTLIWNCK